MFAFNALRRKSSVRPAHQSRHGRLQAAIGEALETRRLFALPSGVSEVDIGNTGLAGSSTYNATTGAYTIKGAGNDLYNFGDAFHYVYMTLPGNGSVTARVNSVSAADTSAPSGLDIRTSLDPSSPGDFLALRPDQLVIENERSAAGETTINEVSTQSAFGEYLRLTRIGNEVISSVSSDGVNFTNVNEQTFAGLTGTAYVGLAVASHDPNALATSTFSNVTFSQTVTQTPSTLPSGFLESDIGNVQGAGTSSYNSGSGTLSVSSASLDLFGSFDSFHYVYQPLLQDGSLTTRVTSISATSNAVPGGIDIRNSLAPGATNILLASRPDGDVVVNSRTSDTAQTSNLVATPAGQPIWLRITRTGNTITSATSSDGQNFTTVDQETLSALPPVVLIGLAVASQNQGTATANFDHIAFSQSTVSTNPTSTGSVTGRVVGLNGAPIAGATMLLEQDVNNVLTSTGLGATTDASGDYTFSTVPVGTYAVVESPTSGLGVAQPAGNVRNVSVTANAVSSGINFTDVATGGTGPDLTIGFASALPKKGKGKVNLRITNVGSVLAKGTVTVTLFVSPDTNLADSSGALTTVNVKVNLKKNKSVVAHANIVLPAGLAAGSYHLVAAVNSSNSLSESNTFNNIASSPGTLTVK